jgi:PKD repeat protein
VTLIADDGSVTTNAVVRTHHSVAINRPPVPPPPLPIRGCAGVPVILDGTAAGDPDGPVSAWQWAFTEGTTALGTRVEHTFAEPGTQQVTLTVDDGSGTDCARRSTSIPVLINHTPVADAGGDRQAFCGGANDAELFDGSASRDADDDTLSYLWDFGDGTLVSGRQVFHVFAEPGEHRVTLTVDDGSGLPCATARDHITVTVRNHETGD